MGRRTYLRRRDRPMAASPSLLVLLALVARARRASAAAPPLDRAARAGARASRTSPGPVGGARDRPRDRRVVFARNADLSLAPASNEKLAVTYAALRRARPRLPLPHRGLRRAAAQVGDVWHGDARAAGFGDPTLTTADLDALAAQVARSGSDASPAQIARRRVLVRRAPDGARLAPELLHQRVAAALGARRRPRLYRGHASRATRARRRGALRQPLAARGRRRVAAHPLGVAPTARPPLATVDSAPLSTSSASMDPESDNFTAELLLKQLGASVRARARRPPAPRSSRRARRGGRPARRRAHRRRLGALARSTA